MNTSNILKVTFSYNLFRCQLLIKPINRLFLKVKFQVFQVNMSNIQKSTVRCDTISLLLDCQTYRLSLKKVLTKYSTLHAGKNLIFEFLSRTSSNIYHKMINGRQIMANALIIYIFTVLVIRDHF